MERRLPPATGGGRQGLDVVVGGDLFARSEKGVEVAWSRGKVNSRFLIRASQMRGIVLPLSSVKKEGIISPSPIQLFGRGMPGDPPWKGLGERFVAVGVQSDPRRPGALDGRSRPPAGLELIS